jgi:hypothetical protein
MFPTSRSHALAGGFALMLAAAGYGCRESPKETRKNDGETPVGASAGDDGIDSDGAGGVPSSGGTSTVDDSSYAGEGEGECRSGQTRCHGQLGFQRCTPDGVWGASQSCGGYSENGTSSYCGLFDAGDGSLWAACVDPACWWWKQSGLASEDAAAGVCVGTEQVRRCVAGILRAPEACDGACRPVGELDGRVLGYCEAACQDGDRECLGGALYRECVLGRWSTEAQSCADGALCQPLAQSAQLDIKCGGACEAGTSRCTEDGSAVEHCREERVWEPAPACALGRCVQSGAQAQCQTECKPGEHACELDGAVAERTCDDLGLWGEPTPCAAGATCRVGTAGALGCMQCVGLDIAGGNVWGVADSRCDDSGVSACAADNAYAAGAPCPAGQACVELSRGAATLAYCK